MARSMDAGGGSLAGTTRTSLARSLDRWFDEHVEGILAVAIPTGALAGAIAEYREANLEQEGR